MIAVDGVVFFQVLDAAKAAYEVSDLYMALMALSTTNLRTVMGSMDLDETLSRRDEVEPGLGNAREPPEMLDREPIALADDLDAHHHEQQRQHGNGGHQGGQHVCPHSLPGP